MSRRPPHLAVERAAQNQQTIKSLLKLEANKICADCKRNKHPRWASWNLGVFICIRCSGIHRGMGTHISRVKSVDLDSWTDEQLQSTLSWGNARANKYWESKLAPGHVPSEAKIDNFIRTKYELKRWVMDGPKPDPATLDTDGDDDIPLSVVKEKQNLERRESVRKGGQSAASRPVTATQPQTDLVDGDLIMPRASTAGPASSKVASKAEPAPPKTTSTKESLLGLDFFGAEPPAPPPRPASTAATPGGQSRPDLKQSILSLYAAAPRPQPQPQASSISFGGMPSSPLQQHSFGGLNDTFSSLSFGNTVSPKSSQNDAFSNLGSFSKPRPTPPQPNHSTYSNLSDGSFFDSKPTSPPPHQFRPSLGGYGGHATFGSHAPALTADSRPTATAPAISAPSNLFNLSSPAAPPPQPAVTSPLPTNIAKFAFNLSNNTSKSPPTAPVVSQPAVSASANSWSESNVWGGNAWATADEPSAEPSKPSLGTMANDFGWGGGINSLASRPITLGGSGGFASAHSPKVSADEEFGGWASGTKPAGGADAGSGGAKPATGLGTSDDLFSNVWQ